MNNKIYEAPKSETIRRIASCLTLILLVTSIISCANRSPTKKEQTAMPNYAMLGGNLYNSDSLDVSDWSVVCDGRNRVFIKRNETQLFYKENGTLKTKNEFCDEYGSGSIIKRRK